MKIHFTLVCLLALFFNANYILGQTKIDSVLTIANDFVGKPFHKKGVPPEKFNNYNFIEYVYKQVNIDLDTVLVDKNKHTTYNIHFGDIVYLNASNKYGIISSGNNFFDMEMIVAEKPKIVKRFLTDSEQKGMCILYRISTKTIENKQVNNIEYNEPEPPLVIDSTQFESLLPDTIAIAMVGDIMLGTTYPEVSLPANDGKNLFDDVRELLVNANLTVGNFEGVMCEGGICTKRVAAGRSYAFRMPTSYAPLLSEAGFDFVSLANNHSNDFGPDGIRSTAKCLDEQGIKYAGAKALNCESAIVERDGIRYGLCAFGHNSHTYQHLELESAKRIVKSLRDSCDILIVSFHGGAEGSKQAHLPQGKEIFLGEDRGTLREFAHTCIDLGADVVYGHGPHVTRAIEAYKGKFIAYSLGNFCTPFGINLAGISGYAPVVTIRILRDGTLIDGKINSFIQQKGIGPKLDTLNKVAQEMKSLTIADFSQQSLDINNDGTFKKKD